MSDPTQDDLDTAEAIKRATWLNDHHAPIEWVIMTSHEMRVLRDRIRQLEDLAKQAAQLLANAAEPDENQMKAEWDTWANQLVRDISAAIP